MPVPRGLIPTRVLVVDDEPLIRWSICAALAAGGFEAVSAATAESARQLAAEWPPLKVAIVDLALSGGEEQELLAEIRAVCPECEFVVMTTERRSRQPDWTSPIRVEVVDKPFDLGALVVLVERLVHPRTAAAASAALPGAAGS